MRFAQIFIDGQSNTMKSKSKKNLVGPKANVGGPI